jgi:uncharacterized protein (TIGR00725 family)
MKKIISIIGPSEASQEELTFAEKIGFLLGSKGFVVATGGKKGVMEAALKGAKEGGGITVAVIPEVDPEAANPFADIVIPTGLGEGRNFILVRTGKVILAVGYSEGTLIEIAIANKIKKPVIGYNIPQIPGIKILEVKTPEEALIKINEYLEGKHVGDRWS